MLSVPARKRFDVMFVTNGSVLSPSNTSKSTFDFGAAADNCYWFSGF
jgi:hypothetical protein